MGQWVDGDAVYLRDFLTWDALPLTDLKRCPSSFLPAFPPPARPCVWASFWWRRAHFLRPCLASWKPILRLHDRLIRRTRFPQKRSDCVPECRIVWRIAQRHRTRRHQRVINHPHRHVNAVGQRHLPHIVIRKRIPRQNTRGQSPPLRRLRFDGRAAQPKFDDRSTPLTSVVRATAPENVPASSPGLTETAPARQQSNCGCPPRLRSCRSTAGTWILPSFKTSRRRRWVIRATDLRSAALSQGPGT